jgi:ComF family protein
MDALRRLVGGFADLLSPLTCGGCGIPGEHLCATCRDGLAANTIVPGCRRCGHPWLVGVDRCPECPVVLTSVRSAVRYTVPATDVIGSFKDARRAAFATDMANLMIGAIRAPPPGTALIPVPTSGTRLRQRGFNPAEEIARALEKAWASPVWDGLARRGKQAPQRGATAVERHTQVAGAFAIRDRDPPVVALLVDDVMTTGSTLVACARVLREHGVRRVGAVTFARVASDRR